MQSYWLAQKGRSSCILFLSGWAMAPAPFKSIPATDHDLLMVYDYRQIEPSAMIRLTEKYTFVHLVAWSMGVWIAGRYFASYRDRFTSTTAVNGTLSPIDDQCGIPPTAFNAMISDFSPGVLDGFYRDMFDQPDQAGRFLNSRPGRSAKSILNELQTLQKVYEELGPGDDIFDHKLVGSRDRIFPARSQLRSWGNENCERIKGAHFPFYDWSSWDQIICRGQGSCD